MIHLALSCLRDELNVWMTGLNQGLLPAALANVAALETQAGANIADGLLLSLVNIEEESTLKNLPAAQKLPNGTTRYEHPPVHLNLYVLVSAHFPPTSAGYENALLHLSRVIGFFQNRKRFTIQNSPDFAEKDNPEVADLQLFLDLYTATFEQINHLWGSLGGKQMPFALYKVRMVEIRDRRPFGQGTLIEELATNEHALV